jgi:Domain of unknown function (DUF4461)
MKHQSRSVYVAQLRRAFLLRAHPDRFRRRPTEIRKQQSVLLQALSDRMMETDFLDYTSNSKVSASQWNHPSINRFSADDDDSIQRQRSKLPYVLEKRDGTLLHNTLNLNSSVTEVLTSLADALYASGAAKLSPPPPMPSSSSFTARSNGNQNVHWAKSMNDLGDKEASQQSFIDHRYDVNTNKGRDLHAFLTSIDPSYIEERRACRMDVSAAALVARRLFSFQSIDGISLGWSSESFVVILNSLIRLHEEHNQRFHVSSFYPLRLNFSLDEFRSKALDVYGGTIYLNPSATQLEWLESLQEVTEDKLEEFFINRRIMEERVSILNEQMGVRVNKGYSCSSEEYQHFLEAMIGPTTPTTTRNSADTTVEASTVVTAFNSLIPLESAVSAEKRWTRLVVESPAACRRAKVTEEGSIRLPSNITRGELYETLSMLSEAAHDRWQVDQRYKEESKHAIQALQWELGVQRVFRTGFVRREEFLGGLSRLLDQTPKLGGKISGFSLGIAGAGRFCSIADDGSLVVPHNWT